MPRTRRGFDDDGMIGRRAEGRQRLRPRLVEHHVEVVEEKRPGQAVSLDHHRVQGRVLVEDADQLDVAAGLDQPDDASDVAVRDAGDRQLDGREPQADQMRSAGRAAERADGSSTRVE